MSTVELNIQIETVDTDISFGRKMEVIESLRKVTPSMMTSRATTNPATYSVLPCPKGCSASGGLPER